MVEITSEKLRDKYLKFFESKGHKIIDSASIIPENDPTVLFTTAGMHPLVPYLLGEKHPGGTRLCNVQRCIRTGDIEEVGDSSHCTFFEMLGNWSLGDYFKKEAIEWSFEFLTKALNIPIDQIAVSVFEGDADAPRDEESAKYWADLGIPADRIFYLPKENNWWGPAGITGPCGPDTEMFIDRGKKKCSPNCGPACDCGKYIEIWNNVFMQYFKNADGTFEPLKQKNVDTGMGLERTLCILGGKNSVYETDLFSGAIKKIEELTGLTYIGSDERTTKAFRIVLDHIRTAVFMLGDHRGITPSNVDQGYVLRRILRRAVRYGRNINLPDNSLKHIAGEFVDKYESVYPELTKNRQKIMAELETEEQKFSDTLSHGLKEFEKVIKAVNGQSKAIAALIENLKLSGVLEVVNVRAAFSLLKEKAPHISAGAAANVLYAAGLISKLPQNIEDTGFESRNIMDGVSAFRLYDTYGFPLEITKELANERGFEVDAEGFEKAFAEHQKKSQSGGEQRFKGGLADSKQETARLHTATHLLQAALRKVCSDSVEQMGSNITAERLRFDFSFNRPLTKDEIQEVEDYVNGAIKANVPVTVCEMSVDEAKCTGALGLFESKYGEKVKVYAVEGYSKEICGGPHALTTGELGGFKIVKEQSSSAGVRRIKAILK